MTNLFITFRQRNNGMMPEHVIVYRDGVGEGQFNEVLDSELPAIKNALAALVGTPFLLHLLTLCLSLCLSLSLLSVSVSSVCLCLFCLSLSLALSLAVKGTIDHKDLICCLPKETQDPTRVRRDSQLFHQPLSWRVCRCNWR
jgi:hypothetical protein